MLDFETLTEAELRVLQEATNGQVNDLRRAGQGAEARQLRQRVLEIAAIADRRQRERYAEYERIAATSDGESVTIAGAVASAISEAVPDARRSAVNRRYYESHRDQVLAAVRRRYYENYEEKLAARRAKRAHNRASRSVTNG